jgi:hypothetical protein
MEDAVSKALEVNDDPPQNREGEHANKSAEEHNKQKNQGKALRVNEDTDVGKEPTKPSSPPKQR